MKRIFIDGVTGAIGSRLFERLKRRRDIEIISLDEELREDDAQRAKVLNQADIVFLCLPETQAAKAVKMVENPDTVIIDVSAAFFGQSGWEYGFPELNASSEENIKKAKRITVPSAHAAGFIALIKPLVDARVIKSDTMLSCFSITGYSIGGKAMAERYKGSMPEVFKAPRNYSLTQNNKSLKEMLNASGLTRAPIFSPVVADFYSGICLSVPLFDSQLNAADAQDIKMFYSRKYSGPVIKYNPKVETDSFLSSAAFSGKDLMEISLTGNARRIMLNARYDNLGKGSAGAAIECMNIIMGVNRAKGLEIL